MTLRLADRERLEAVERAVRVYELSATPVSTVVRTIACTRIPAANLEIDASDLSPGGERPSGVAEPTSAAHDAAGATRTVTSRDALREDVLGDLERRAGSSRGETLGGPRPRRRRWNWSGGRLLQRDGVGEAVPSCLLVAPCAVTPCCSCVPFRNTGLFPVGFEQLLQVWRRHARRSARDR